MKTLKLPEGMRSVNIEGEDYAADENGLINVVETHVKQAMSVGAVDPNAEVITPVIPTELLEGGKEAMEALIAENEILKREARDTGSKYAALHAKFTEQTADLATAVAALDAMQAERDTLLAQLNGIDVAGDGTTTISAEPGAETGAAATGGDVAADAAAASGGASPSADVVDEEEGDGLAPLEPEMPNFDGFEYNPLREWLKGRGVIVTSIKKTDAVALCKKTYTDHKAAADAAAAAATE